MRNLWSVLVVACLAAFVAGCPSVGEDGRDSSDDTGALDAGASARVDVASHTDIVDREDVAVAVDVEALGREVRAPETHDGPCIEVTPSALDFGAVECLEEKVLPLVVESCGEAPLNVYGFMLTPSDSPAFALDVSMLDHEPALDDPLVIAPGESVSLNVRFTPPVASQVLSDGTLKPFLAILTIPNTAEPIKQVELKGFGVTIEAPVAVIECQEGDQVIPGTVLHLDGTKSYEGCGQQGAISMWQWEVVAPEGSLAQFIPSANHPTPAFEVDVAGLYTFYLVVYDDNNTPCCFPAEYPVTVNQVRHLDPEEYTNEPIEVGQVGMGFQCDGLGVPAAAVQADDRCAVLHGIVESVSTAFHAKVVEGGDLLGLEGVQVVWDGQEVALWVGEVLFGNEEALGPPITGIGSCPRVLVAKSNTLYEGWFGENGICEVPFILDGVTYLAMVGMEAVGFGNCVPWSLAPEAEVYLFVRTIAEDNRTYIIAPFLVQEGIVQSPCCPTGQMSPAAFEEALAGLLDE